MTPAISVSGLTKKYGEIEAVRGIDFEVAAGETFGQPLVLRLERDPARILEGQIVRRWLSLFVSAKRLRHRELDESKRPPRSPPRAAF